LRQNKGLTRLVTEKKKSQARHGLSPPGGRERGEKSTQHLKRRGAGGPDGQGTGRRPRQMATKEIGDATRQTEKKERSQTDGATPRRVEKLQPSKNFKAINKAKKW